jgi:hypothetical protein
LGLFFKDLYCDFWLETCYRWSRDLGTGYERSIEVIVVG